MRNVQSLRQRGRRPVGLSDSNCSRRTGRNCRQRESCPPASADARSTIHDRRMLPTARAMPEAQLDEEIVASGASYLKVEQCRIARRESGAHVPKSLSERAAFAFAGGVLIVGTNSLIRSR